MKSADAQRNVQNNAEDNLNWRNQNQNIQNIYNIYSKELEWGTFYKKIEMI